MVLISADLFRVQVNAIQALTLIYLLTLTQAIVLNTTREITAFGGISLALRGSGAFGATFGCLRRPFGKPPPSAAVKE